MEQSRLEMKISERKMFFKFMRMIMYRVIKGEFYLPAVSEITADDLLDRINSNLPPLLIDVRPAREFNEGFGHIPNARLIPLMELASNFEDLQSFKEKIVELASNFEDLQSFKEKEIVTICPGGGMSLVAAEIMAEADFRDLKSLTGGIDLWFKKGYPTITS